ncbi:MAG: flagellar biosynthesis protein FlhF [Burkholderiaceae bacterium]
MNVKRYVAKTAKEALAKVRAELGADAVVLKNRPVPGGVEILAMADEPALDSIDAASPLSMSDAAAPAGAAGAAANAAANAAAAGRGPAGRGDEADEPMSTVSFEAYVRDRQQRRVAERNMPGEPGAAMQSAARPSMAMQSAAMQAVSAADSDAIKVPRRRGDGPAEAAMLERAAAALPGYGDDAIDTQALLTELRAMRGFISDRLESMSWFEGVRRRPVQSRMLRRLLQRGFSAMLARTLVNHLPADFSDDEADQWLAEALRRNLRVDAPAQTVFEQGGTFALLGPTGVGKTTTAAKIAAQFALKHGAQSVGLITADVYRIGAQDQLRTFGRLLGVPVHVAHDVAALADFLQLFMNKKLVLIDTAGVGQRDERVGELLAALGSTQVRRVVVVNAASQAEAIEEVIETYQARTAAGIVLSKVDETVQLGGALDCLIRHRLSLQGIANGQRVPEDWHRPDAATLVARALAAPERTSPFSFEESELAMLLTAAGRGTNAMPMEAHGV